MRLKARGKEVFFDFGRSPKSKNTSLTISLGSGGGLCNTTNSNLMSMSNLEL